MAIVDKYVAVVATGDGTGSSPDNAMDWATLRGASWMTKVANDIAGTRFNIQAGTTYTLSATDTWTSDGTATQPIILRGCDSSWNPITPTRMSGNLLLDTSSMPYINYNGNFRLDASGSTNVIFMALRIAGAGLSVYALSSGNNAIVYGCDITNSGNDSASGALSLLAQGVALSCDLACTNATASGSGIFLNDTGAKAIGCIVKDSKTHGITINAINCVVLSCLVYGHEGYGIRVSSTGATTAGLIAGNTVYGGNGIYLRDTAYTSLCVILNNHVTDGGEYAFKHDNAIGCPVLFANNRTRDNLSGTISWNGDWDLATTWNHITVGETRGPSVDFVNAAGGNFNLVASAPAKAAGVPKYMDIGALQRQEPSNSYLIFQQER